MAKMAKSPDPLRAHREANDLSQQEVADKLKISRAMVGLLETGEREYSAEMAILIEEKLGIDRAKVRPDLFKRESRAA